MPCNHHKPAYCLLLLMMHSLIIFASGRGSNAAAIIDYFKKTGQAKVSLIVCNKPDAGVLDIARNEEIPFLIVDKNTIRETLICEQINEYNPSLIILAGFLWKVPDNIINLYKGRIINIHPALLPRYGGKGMYGMHVHEAVMAAGEQESGITIHYVDEVYDSGAIIAQAHCSVDPKDNPHTLAGKIHKLEHFYFPRVLEYLLNEI
jgi:phosphoribosylglycinamide formyltransferase-1